MAAAVSPLEEALVERLAELVAGRVLELLSDRLGDPSPGENSPPTSWRERLWTAHPETRLGVRELAEALGKSRSWVYSRTSRSCPTSRRIPHSLDDSGELSFRVGEIRDWLVRSETRVLSIRPSADNSVEDRRRKSA